MAYEVLARKWRPQQFEDVVGQDHVTQTLINAIESNRLAHAYLFVGPRGIGKTSLARIFSKALNCEKGPTGTPCDVCDSCREIVAGNNLDVLEIDGASNNGVEQVRELRETVKYLPVRSSFKIYIIDEVHMLSAAAFNALLKTLEEPPAHVKFLFATTEPDKILSTIVSRCQRFDLRRISIALIIERLQMIAKDEALQIDDDALLAIARGAEGGLRDAESSLDQLISFKGKVIAEDDVLAVFGLVSRGMLERLAENILTGDMKELIRAVAELDAAGKDLQRLILDLMEYFRNLLVCLHMGDSTDGLDLSEAQLKGLREQGANLQEGRVMRILEILSDAQSQGKYALSKRTLLETSLLRCARAATVVTLEEILQKMNMLRQARAGENDHTSEGTMDVSAAPPRPVGRTVVAESSVPAYTAVTDSTEEDYPDELDRLINAWGEIVDRIARIAPLTRGSLVDTGPLSVTRERVLVGYDPGFAEDIRNLGHARNHAAVERVIRDVLNRSVTVEFVAAEEPHIPTATVVERSETLPAEESALSSDDAEEGDSTLSSDAEEGDSKVRGQKRKSPQEWAKDPVVRESLDLFDGYIAEVRE